MRKRERVYMKIGFALDTEVAERLRDVAFYTRRPASGIVEDLIREHVFSSKFRRIPKRPRKR